MAEKERRWRYLPISVAQATSHRRPQRNTRKEAVNVPLTLDQRVALPVAVTLTKGFRCRICHQVSTAATHSNMEPRLMPSLRHRRGAMLLSVRLGWAWGAAKLVHFPIFRVPGTKKRASGAASNGGESRPDACLGWESAPLGGPHAPEHAIRCNHGPSRLAPQAALDAV